jgi:hypothetical protein
MKYSLLFFATRAVSLLRSCFKNMSMKAMTGTHREAAHMTSLLTRGDRGDLAEQIMRRTRISPLPTPPVLPLSGEGRKRSPWRVRVGGLIGLFLKQLLAFTPDAIGLFRSWDEKEGKA